MDQRLVEGFKSIATHFRVVFVGFAASDDEHMPRNGVIKTISSHNDLVVFGVHRIDDVFEFEACSVDVSMPQPLDRPQGDQYFTVVRRIRLKLNVDTNDYFFRLSIVRANPNKEDTITSLVHSESVALHFLKSSCFKMVT